MPTQPVLRSESYLLSDYDMSFNPGWFGGRFLHGKTAQKVDLYLEADDSIGPRFGQALTVTTKGGHQNGPGGTRAGQWLLVQKEDYLTTEESGEIDGLYLSMAQGYRGDVGGVIIGVTKVFREGIADSGSTPIEIASMAVRPDGSYIRHVQVVVGLMDADVGNQLTEARGSGLFVEARRNVNNSAIHVTGFTAFNGVWEHILRASTSRLLVDEYFGITGTGRINMNKMPTRVSLNPGGGDLQVMTTLVDGTVQSSLVVKRSGNIRMTGALSVGNFTQGQLADKTHWVNTTDKLPGAIVHNVSSMEHLRASGTGATSSWNRLSDNSVAITPV